MIQFMKYGSFSKALKIKVVKIGLSLVVSHVEIGLSLVEKSEDSGHSDMDGERERECQDVVN